MTPAQQDESLQPVAGALAYLIPGLGYLALGDTKRALFVFLGVMWLFLGGILIGGIDVIDRQDDKWWFLLQAGVGPAAFTADYIHQNHLKDERVNPNTGRREFLRPAPPRPTDTSAQPAPYTPSLGRVNEVGSLFAAIAGMLNAIAVIDCLWNTRRRKGARK